MKCTRPLTAYKSDAGVSFRETPNCIELKLPCGQCADCRLERSRQWAIRCLHEAKTHKTSCFITLTYDDEHLPEHANLQYRDFQLFLKRLRRARAPKKIRFYACGEYGETTERPHYHACIFGTNFPDKTYHCKTPQGETLWKSNELNKLWPHGHSLIGSVTFESAAYVARYIMKKITGQMAKEHYKRLNKETGEIYTKTPEFNKMSLKPAIGKTWLIKYWEDVFPNGTVISRGREVRSPRYYDKILKQLDPDLYEQLTTDRQEAFHNKANYEDLTATRLQDHETVTTARIALLKRSIE